MYKSLQIDGALQPPSYFEDLHEICESKERTCLGLSRSYVSARPRPRSVHCCTILRFAADRLSGEHLLDSGDPEDEERSNNAVIFNGLEAATCRLMSKSKLS